MNDQEKGQVLMNKVQQKLKNNLGLVRARAGFKPIWPISSNWAPRSAY